MTQTISRTFLCLSTLVCLVVGCKKKAASITPLSPIQIAVSERIVYRFLDHVAEAHIRQEPKTGSLKSAYDNFEMYPYKMRSPSNSLAGDAAYASLNLAVADKNVARYATGTPCRAMEMPKFGKQWNASEGVYQSKQALFSPPGTSHTFVVPPVGEGYLEFSLIALSSDANASVDFFVESQGSVMWKKTVRTLPLSGQSRQSCEGRWASVRVPVRHISAGKQLTFRTASSNTTPILAAFGNPVLYEKQQTLPQKNVVFIVVDTLRADALPVMPRLTALAQQGVLFEKAITAATWTRPSLLSMFSGYLPTATGQNAEDMIPHEEDRNAFYSAHRPLLPAQLRTRGFHTAAIGNNFFLLGYPQIGLDMGFEEVDDIRHGVLDAPATTRAAGEFLRQNTKRPFFLYLHYDAPHYPYTPPSEYRRNAEKFTALSAKYPDPLWKDYLAEAMYADAQIGQVLDELDRLHLREKTMIVVVGDHGEIFDPEHNHVVLSQNFPTLHHHGWSAYDEILHVPLILSAPHVWPAGKKVSSLVRLTDIAPTLREQIWETPIDVTTSNDPMVGRSLLPLMKDQLEASRIAFVEGQNIRALRTDDWLYLHRTDGRLKKVVNNSPAGNTYVVNEELYDVKRDPSQHHNLSSFVVPREQEALRFLRTEFERLQPKPPFSLWPLLHLRVAPCLSSCAQRQFTGELVSAQDLVVTEKLGRVNIDEKTNKKKLSFVLSPNDGFDVRVFPGASVVLRLKIDGKSYPVSSLLLGPYALPLGQSISGRFDELLIDKNLWSVLRASEPPVLGNQGDILLWSNQTELRSVDGDSQNVQTRREVQKMMQDWGYAQE